MDVLKTGVEKEPELITPLYRTILDPVQSGDFIPVPKFNYNAYNVFVLRSRLRFLLKKRWGPGINVIFSSSEYNGKLHLKANLFKGRTNMNLNKAERDDFKKMLEEAMEENLDYAVVISNSKLSYRGEIMPDFWVKSILHFIKLRSRKIDIKYRVGKYGLEANTYGFEHPSHGQSFIELDNQYMSTYLDIQTEVTETLWHYHRSGHIVNPTSSVIKDWDLVLNSTKTNFGEDLSLYRPNLIDRRLTDPFGGMVSFLYSRILGDTNIKIYVGMDLIVRYHIAKNIGSHFSGSYLERDASDLTQANQILNIIVSLLTRSGTALAFKIESEHINVFKIAAFNMGYEGVAYTIDSVNGRSTMFSIEIEPNKYYLNNSYITKLKQYALSIYQKTKRLK